MAGHNLGSQYGGALGSDEDITVNYIDVRLSSIKPILVQKTIEWFICTCLCFIATVRIHRAKLQWELKDTSTCLAAYYLYQSLTII